MGLFPKGMRWGVIAPIALVVIAVFTIGWLDVAKGGEAKPKPPIGEIGTPVRNAYIPPTATPQGLRPQPTTIARPTVNVPAGAAGTSEQRDGQRRVDLLVLLDAANKVKAADGSYPTTKGNVQTICAFKELDVGCRFKNTLGKDVPLDPLGDPVKNGYWYSSDGNTVTVYANLESPPPADEKCPTNDTELKKKANLICAKAP